MMTTPYSDRVTTLRGYGNVRAERKNVEFCYTDYVIRTEWGIVYVYTQFGHQSPNEDYTEMEFIYDRRLHQRRWRRHWSRRTIITLAKQFAADAINSEAPF